MSRARKTLRTGLGALVLGCVVLACARPGTPSSPAPPALERTRWALVALGAASTPIAKTQGPAFLLLGEPPGRVGGSGGCNRLAGTYTQAGDALTFGPIAGTRMACADGMQVEDALHAALAATAAFRIAGDRLELRDASGALLAAFQARAAD